MCPPPPGLHALLALLSNASVSDYAGLNLPFKKLEEKEVRVEELLGPEQARETIAEAIEAYRAVFPGAASG